MIDKDNDAPPIAIIREATQMMNGHGAPQFSTQREKREAIIKLARSMWKGKTK